ncbi:MAG: RNA 2',3'-cyclic phosphodiesterase [Candidatus Bathyarchaeia archaeon]
MCIGPNFQRRWLDVRVFISVDVEDGDLLDALEGAQRRLERTGADLKCVERQNIHATLKFLGDVREGLVGELKRIVSGMMFNAFRVELRGLGAFPNLRRPRVVWVGITDGVEELSDISRRLESEFEGLGFRREGRRFSPHITLARVRSGRNRDRLVDEVMASADEVFGEFQVEHVRLKKSVLTPRGPIYSTLAESTS